MALDPNNASALIINLSNDIPLNGALALSYSGASILAADNQVLPKFTNFVVAYLLPARILLPARLETENFSVNNGFVFDSCSDAGGGQDAGYSDVNDYLDFYVSVNEAGVYKFNYRVAGYGGAGQLVLINNGVKTVLHLVNFPNTNGWQTWQTVSASANLPKGAYTLRFIAAAANFSLNYIDCSLTSGIKDVKKKNEISVAPNPTNGILFLTSENDLNNAKIEILTMTGMLVYESRFANLINLQHLSKGIYFLKINTGKSVNIEKIIIQ